MCLFMAPVAAGAAAAGSAAAGAATTATLAGTTAAAAAGSGAALSAAGAAAAAGATAGTAMAGGAIAPVVTGLTAAEMFHNSTAVSALGALGSIAGQTEAQKRGKEYAKAQTEAARVATINSYDQLQLQRQEELENASQRIADTALEGARARAKAATAAGEAGISGLSVDALMADLQRQQSGFTETVKTNFSRKSAQIDATMEGIHAGAQSTLNQIPEPKAPDYVGAAVRAGGETWGAYRDWDRYERGKLKIPA